ncbi:MAG: phosphoribosyltransferase family protein [Oscillospiraceae bacterium]
MDKINIEKSVIDFFIPPKCMFCQEILVGNKPCKCYDRVMALQWQEPDRVRKETYKEFKDLDFCISFYNYKDIVRSALIRAKFKSCVDFVDNFLQYIPIDLKEFIVENNIDILVCVPVHKSKFYQKEFDLPQEMTKKIAKLTKTEYNFKLIAKVKKTKNQHDLSIKERKTNLDGAFSVKGDVTGKNILVIDDILTTGHTLDTVAQQFKAAGSGKVIGMTFAYSEHEESRK